MSMGRRTGYEHRYSFSADDGIILRYGSWYEILNARFVFEIRTKFTVKGKFDDGGADEKLIDSEAYDVGLIEKERNEWGLKVWLGSRLGDYWMSDREIQEFVRQALAFLAKQTAADGARRHGLIPTAVDMVVCTVQQEGEPIDATMDRAIVPEYLYPLRLCPWIEASRPKKIECLDIYRLDVLRHKLRTVRVEEVDRSSSFMEVCRICSRSPAVGAQISSLQCGHAFHYRCIAQWLANTDSCPTCGRQAHDAFSKRKKSVLKQLMMYYPMIF